MSEGILAYGHDIGAESSTMRFIGLDPATMPDWYDTTPDGPPTDVQLAARLLDQAGIVRPADQADYVDAMRADLGVDLVEHGAASPRPWLLVANGSTRRATAGDPLPIRGLIPPDQADEHVASAVGSLGLDVPATPGWLITARGA
jgi:hypothetical protein